MTRVAQGCGPLLMEKSNCNGLILIGLLEVTLNIAHGLNPVTANVQGGGGIEIDHVKDVLSAGFKGAIQGLTQAGLSVGLDQGWATAASLTYEVPPEIVRTDATSGVGTLKNAPSAASTLQVIPYPADASAPYVQVAAAAEVAGTSYSTAGAAFTTVGTDKGKVFLVRYKRSTTMYKIGPANSPLGVMKSFITTYTDGSDPVSFFLPEVKLVVAQAFSFKAGQNVPVAVEGRARTPIYADLPYEAYGAFAAQ